jgi:hypothetical protein
LSHEPVQVAAPESATIGYGLRRLAEKTGIAVVPQARRRLAVVLDPSLGRGAYRVEASGAQWRVAGGDDVGALYGLMELADQVADAGPDAVRAAQGAPRLGFRGVKFNLPWDAYRPGEAMTLNIETCQEPEMWIDLLDMMVECRFNALSIWNLHPFPFMFQPRGFPEARIFDDRRMAEWQELWRFLFREARVRGIETWVFFWTIFVSRPFAETHDIRFPGVEYYIGPGDTSELVKRYNRQCVKQLIEEYPDLTGIGVSLGERMENMSADERERWVEDVVIAGIKEAVRPPGRPIKFNHRAPFTADPVQVRQVIEKASLPGEVLVEYKFNWSHGHSTPGLARTHDVAQHSANKPAIDDRYWNPPPTRHKMVWMVRNEDFFVLRWGEPDFVREHVRLNAHHYVAGYFVGAEGMIPARDLAHRPGADRGWHYVFQKQWLFWMVWGRLLYDPAAPDAVFARAFERRYGAGVGERMVEAWKRASRMPLRLASFYGASWDYTLYAEGFLAPFPTKGSRDVKPEAAFISIDRLIDQPTLDPQLMSIPDFVAAEAAGALPAGPAARVTPLALADALEADGRRVRVLAAELAGAGAAARPAGFASELGDLEAWAALSLYFAAKLRGGVSLQRARTRGDAAERAEAVAQLEAAVAHWDAVVAATEQRYREVPYICREKSGYSLRFSWAAWRDAVKRDVEIARG